VASSLRNLKFQSDGGAREGVIVGRRVCELPRQGGGGGGGVALTGHVYEMPPLINHVSDDAKPACC